jgi:saccharopine dehydrogenase-like NADP-dependent oxidoreductase
VRDVDFKMGGFNVAKYRTLFHSGLLSDEPVKINDAEVSPLQVVAALTPPTITPEDLEKKIKDGTIRGSVSMRAVEVEGEKEGKKTKLSFQITHPDIQGAFERIRGSSHMSYTTGISAAAFAKAILAGKVQRRGVFPPECLDQESRRFILDELGKYDIRVEKR